MLELTSSDQFIAQAAAIRAGGHAKDAASAADQIREAVGTFEAARAGNATPYIARHAAVAARAHVAKMAYNAAKSVFDAEFQAERARRVAMTPLANKFATEAGESVILATRYANDALRMSYAA